jgi:pSer/pThr/pTyr-binding forkhead associated (FHA) protein
VPTPDVEPAAALGATKIFRPSDTEAVSAEDAEQLGLAHQPAVLVVNGKRHPLPADGTVVIGRSRDADITVEDPNISRRHAEIRRDDGAFWIVDLGSTNGIEVNGRRVDRAKLSHSDTVVLGRTDVVFENPGG